MADELDAEVESRPVWGAWIEIWLFGLRSPLRVRSRPVWGAWIEIPLQVLLYNPLYCRAPYGARGLKFIVILYQRRERGRAPYGARGLKYRHRTPSRLIQTSRPVWGAWIEISPAM